MSENFSTFARKIACRAHQGVLAHSPPFRVRYTPLNNKTMASWQDIKAFEERIYDVVDEYLGNAEAYQNAFVRVWLDEDDMTYKAEVDDNLSGTEDDGVYAIAGLLRDGDDGKEPNIDRISDIANSWIFLD